MKHEARNSKYETISNTKVRNAKRISLFRFRFQKLGLISDFGFRISDFRAHRGITLLLVVLVLSALLSISLGIFNSVFTEFRISGEIADSFTALYAADQAIERVFYLDRGPSGPLCAGSPGDNCFVECAGISNPACTVVLPPLPNGSCYISRVDKTFVNASTTEVRVRATGEYRCGVDILSVKRALQTEYIGR